MEQDFFLFFYWSVLFLNGIYAIKQKTDSSKTKPFFLLLPQILKKLQWFRLV